MGLIEWLFEWAAGFAGIVGVFILLRFIGAGIFFGFPSASARVEKGQLNRNELDEIAWKTSMMGKPFGVARVNRPANIPGAGRPGSSDDGDDKFSRTPASVSTTIDTNHMSLQKEKLDTERAPESLTIVLLSDTHEIHREVEVPNGDLVIHAGDFTMNSMSAEKLIDINDWLGELPHAFRVVIPGNHDLVVEDPSRRQLITNATLLINEGIEVMGLKIWGTPTTPLLGEAFGVVSDSDRAKLYSNIPADTDVLVTHGPPYGILDLAPGAEYEAGCEQLLAAVRRVKPMLHIFGHVHAGYGTFSTPDTLFVNAALPGRDYDLSNPPHVFSLPRR